MQEMVKVNNQEVAVIEWNNERVITTAQLANIYETDINNVQVNFSRNKNRFTEGKHYIFLQGNELKEYKRLLTESQHPLSEELKFVSQLYLWTKQGASRHCKILDTEKAWEQFDYLEEAYFNPYHSIFDGISDELRAAIVVDKRVTKVEQRVNKLENNMTITHEQIQIIKNRVNQKITRLLGGHESNAYKDKSLSGKVYSRFNKDYRDYFRINARANTLIAKFDEALQYIDMWEPDTNLRLQISCCNAQVNLGTEVA